MQPLIGPNDDSIGPRFPDQVDAWSPRLRQLMRRAAVDEDIAVEEGVYMGLTGPSYETPAEVRMLRTFGADAVGMSTVLEAIAARWAGIELVGVSLVTNPGAGVTGLPLSHEEVLAAAEAAGPKFTPPRAALPRDPRRGDGFHRTHVTAAATDVPSAARASSAIVSSRDRPSPLKPIRSAAYSIASKHNSPTRPNARVAAAAGCARADWLEIDCAEQRRQHRGVQEVDDVIEARLVVDAE